MISVDSSARETDLERPSVPVNSSAIIKSIYQMWHVQLSFFHIKIITNKIMMIIHQ